MLLGGIYSEFSASNMARRSFKTCPNTNARTRTQTHARAREQAPSARIHRHCLLCVRARLRAACMVLLACTCNMPSMLAFEKNLHVLARARVRARIIHTYILACFTKRAERRYPHLRLQPPPSSLAQASVTHRAQFWTDVLHIGPDGASNNKGASNNALGRPGTFLGGYQLSVSN